MTEFELARLQIQRLLRESGGNADLLYRAIRIAQNTAAGTDDYCDGLALAYQLQKLSLADITGNLHYRL
jgi:hypothetical protein